METYSEQEHYIGTLMNELHDFISQQDNGYTNGNINIELGNMSDDDIERFHSFIFNNANKALKNKILETLAETNTLVKNTIILQGKEELEAKERLIDGILNLVVNKEGLLILIYGLTGIHANHMTFKENLNNFTHDELKKFFEIAEKL